MHGRGAVYPPANEFAALEAEPAPENRTYMLFTVSCSNFSGNSEIA